MPSEKKITGLGLGIHSIPKSTESIPAQSASDSLGWISTDNQIELTRGRNRLGAELTANGNVQGHGYGYKADGTTVQFRKINTKIQYYNTTTGLWVDIITGLTSGAEYTFSPYSSLAGTFIFPSGVDGIFKIHTANPASYATMHDTTSDFRGKSIIDTQRMYLWDRPKDKTGLYHSYNDAQNGTVYTTVTGEATTGTSGTLAFKAGGAKRTCFNIKITITSGGQVYTDNYNGVLSGSLGGTGTINYMTGAWTVSAGGAGTAEYQWEDSTSKGVCDFTFSAIRLPGEGGFFSQDEGGDAIQTVQAFEGKYYSLKKRSVYKLVVPDDDKNEGFSNLVFRKRIGLEYWRSAVSTGKGIIFMDTANPEQPRLTILTPNAIGDNLEPVILAKQFDFSAYEWDMCAMETFGEFIIFSGRTPDNSTNNKLFLYNFRRGTIDILPYFAKTLVDIEGRMYIGDTTTENVYEIFTGFDDDELEIENYWISGDDLFGTNRLKKVRRFRIKGVITPSQKLEVYMTLDGGTTTLVGTILGDGSYVSFDNSTFTIGESGIGTSVIGGESSGEDGNVFFTELHISQGKFRKMSIKLKATGIGYVSVNMYEYHKIGLYENRLPKANRQMQNVSLDGTLTNQ